MYKENPTQEDKVKKTGRIPWNKGKKTPEETRKKQSLAKKKNPTRYWLGKKRPEFSPEWKKNMARIPWNKGIPDLLHRGSNHHNWKGGATSERERLRKSIEYKLWRTSVFERDDYTCRFCSERGGRLEADHIKPWCDYPELRFAIDNGRTLCHDCHTKTDTYLMITGRNQYSKKEGK